MYQEGHVVDDVTSEVAQLVAKVKDLTADAVRANDRFSTLKASIREWFSDQFTDGEESINLDRDEVNEFFDLLDIPRLDVEYEVTLTVSITATVMASSEEDAVEAVENGLTVESGSLDIEWETAEGRASQA